MQDEGGTCDIKFASAPTQLDVFLFLWLSTKEVQWNVFSILQRKAMNSQSVNSILANA